MNLIPMIREAFGLKVNEEFIVDHGNIGHKYTYRFTDDKIQCYNERDEKFEDGGCLWTLASIVVGQYKVQKIPFKPNEEDLYYFISLDNGDAMGAYYHSDMSHHKLRVKSGNCYCTREEAEKHSDEWMSKVYGENWKELLK